MEKESNTPIVNSEKDKPDVTVDQINAPKETSVLSALDKKKMSAMLGGHKDNLINAIVNEKDQPLRKVVDHTPKHSIYFKNCHNSHYAIDEYCTKLLIEGCTNCSFTVNGKIVTSTVDIWRSDNVQLNINTFVGTLQADVCKKLSITYNKKEHLQTIVWAQVYDLALDFLDGPEHKMITGFEHESQKYPNLALHMDQFIIRFVKDVLMSEQIVRLNNGYPTTEREAKEFDRRQEENLQKLAKQMGISVGKKKTTTPKQKPNETCSCGSGKKFKKCHGMGG